MTLSEPEDASLEEFDQALTAIFLKELRTQVQSLKSCEEAISKNPKNKARLGELIRTIQAIIQAGKIIRIVPLVDACKFLVNGLIEINEERADWDETVKSILKQILEFLTSLSLISSSSFDRFVKSKTEFLIGISRSLAMSKKHQLEAPPKTERIEEKKSIPSEDSEPLFFDAKMYDLFQAELEMQANTLSQGLLELEKNPKDATLLEKLMRGAHSIKGAARVIALNPIVRLAHAMEDCFVAAQKGEINIQEGEVDLLLRGVDVLSNLASLKLEETNDWAVQMLPQINQLILELSACIKKPGETLKKQIAADLHEENAASKLPTEASQKKIETSKSFQTSYAPDRVLRITAENLNRLMGLAGESLVESRWLFPFGENLQKYKSNFKNVSATLDLLRDNLRKEKLNEAAQHSLTNLHDQLHEIYNQFTEHLGELENFIGRYSTLSDRLYQAVVNSRMRPFADGIEAFPRMVRDLGRQLGKLVKLEILGKSTQVDRDILEKLESPLSHLLRNAVVHGIETPEERNAAGKQQEGTITLEARHKGGMLAITVSDDGKGIDAEQLRKKIVEKKYLTQEMAHRLTTVEIIDFLFLPGFSTSESLSDISGRGVGLNIVQTMAQEVGGSVRITFIPGNGASFHLQLPVTLSVLRALMIEISGEVYALPLARIDQTFLIERERIEMIENRQFFHYEDQNIGLVSAWQVLELDEPQINLNDLPVIIVSDRLNRYGLVIDRFLGEKELVVQELDPRLGKVPNIIASAVLEDGSPVLILDVEDVVRSIDNLLSGGRLTKLSHLKHNGKAAVRKRILVVDDSITVREVECRLLKNQGYEVETAVNGMDGWNALRVGHYDLIISDVDMPRMNGIELLKAIKSDPNYRNLPVLIVSYKSTEEDRLKGLEAGADYYLTKSSFHDTTLIDAVFDLIGKP